MKKTTLWSAAVAATVLVFAGGVTAVASEGNRHPTTTAAADATELTGAAVLAEESSTGWQLGSSVADPTAGGVVTGGVVAAPKVSVTPEVSVALDVDTISQYWFWASGIEVNADGFAPGEGVRVSVVFPTGERKTWAPVAADDAGAVTAVVRYLDVDPENTRPDAGMARIEVTGVSGAVGAALLDVVRDAGEVLQVSTNPASLSQDAFLDQPVMVRVTGFAPLDSVFFNLGFPDTSMVAVGQQEGLHADENGVFEYELQVPTANSQVGEWLLSFQSGSDLQGSGTFEVTAGVPRAESKSITLARSSLTIVQLSTPPGLPLTVTDFAPFDTYEMLLTTPYGLQESLGFARTNGEGRSDNRIVGPAESPAGTYVIMARSTTTGDFARASFVVEGEPDAAVLRTSADPAVLTGADFAAPSRGVTLSGSGFEPYVGLRVSVRDAQWHRIPLLVGADTFVNVGEDGTFALPLVSLNPTAAGSYTIWVTGGGGVRAYDLRLDLQVTDTLAPTQSVAPRPTAPTSSTPARETSPAEPAAPPQAPASPQPAAPDGSESITPDGPPFVDTGDFNVNVPDPITR